MRTKKYINIMLLMLTIIVLASCSDENEDEYYVKYEVCVTTNAENAINRVGMTTPTGITYSTIVGSTNTWEATFGPVSKGFEANITASDFTNATGHTFRILVSKNNSPFIVKSEGDGKYLWIRYVLDY